MNFSTMHSSPLDLGEEFVSGGKPEPLPKATLGVVALLSSSLGPRVKIVLLPSLDPLLDHAPGVVKELLLEGRR